MAQKEREDLQYGIISIGVWVTIGLTIWGCNVHGDHIRQQRRERKEAQELKRKAEFQKQVTERKKAAYKAYGECMKGANGDSIGNIGHRIDCGSLLNQIEWP